MTASWNKVKQTLILALIASTGLAVIIGADRHFRDAAEQSEATELQHALTRTADLIEKNLSNRISAVESLAAFMQYTRTRPGLDQFDRFSESLQARHQTIRLFVLVDTERVIRHVYPMPGNESVIGLDLRRRPAAPFVETAIREKRTTINHPTRTVQGFLAIVARTPFYRDGRLEGLVGGVFDIAQIMAEAASINSPMIGFELRDARGSKFHGTELSHAYPLTENILVGDNYWQLRIGWTSAPPGPSSELLGLLWIGGLTLLAAILALVWRGQTRERWLEAAVAERTKELVDSEERYKLVENAVGDGIWDINLLTHEVYHSPRWEQILGYANHELPNDRASFFDRIHPDDRAAANEAIRRHLEENVRYTCELRLRHKDGSYRWVLSRGDAVRDAAGRPIRVVGTITDITDRVTAEQALRVNEERLRLALEASGQGTWDLDFETTKARYSAEYAEMLGYAAEELSGADKSTFEGLLHPADRESVWGAFGEHLAGKTEKFQSEFRLRTKDGAWKWVLSYAKIVERSADGRPLRMAGTHMDIDDRKRLTESVLASEARLRHLLALSPIVIYSSEASGDYALTYISPNVRDLFGLRPEQFLDDPSFWRNNIHPDDVPRVFADLPKLFVNGAHISEYRFRAADGQYRWVRDKMRLIHDVDGAPREIIGSWGDFTERKQAKEALFARKQELVELYSAMHSLREDERSRIARELHDELGQMITALRIDISWLEAHLSSVEPTIVGKLSAMNGLVDQTVDSIRRISEDLRPAMLDSLGLVATLENFTDQFTKRTNIPCELITINADSHFDEKTAIVIFRTVQEALTNVTRHANASNASVRLLRNNDEISLTVRDDGRGLVNAPVVENTGLGLRGIRERIAILGGQFTILSEPGQGVCLNIRIPTQSRKAEQ